MIDNEKYPISPGMIFFMTPVNMHMVTAQNAELITIMFSENMCNSIILSHLNDNGKPIALLLSEAAKNFIRTNSEELLQNTDDRVFSQFLLDCITAKLYKELPDNDLISAANTSSLSKKVMLYIINNFRNHISLNDAADFAGLSPSYFSLVFKKETGISFKEYLDSLRFDYAKKLLLFSDMTIQQICTDSGFDNYENLVQRFKQKFKTSPSRYRLDAKI